MGADDEEVVAEPDNGGEGRGGKAEAKEGTEAVSGAGPEEPGDRGEEKDGGGLGEDHEGKKEAEGEERQGLEDAGSEGSVAVPCSGGVA